MFFLFNMIASIILSILDNAIGISHLLSGLYSLAVLLPSLAVTFRRLHDTGRTGAWVLIGLIPFIGAIVLLVFMCTDGQSNDNQYGPDPKATV